MSSPTAMPPARRRPIPGMSANPTAPEQQAPAASPAAESPPPIVDAPFEVPSSRAPSDARPPVIETPPPELAAAETASVPLVVEESRRQSAPAPGGPGSDGSRGVVADDRGSAGARGPAIGDAADGVVARWPAEDYAATRLVNFRLPVDLHDRYKRLVAEAELRHPKLRHPSLTELLVAMLEEGPSTAEEVAALIRRKRASEHQERS